MDESPWTAVIIIALFIVAEMAGWTRERYLQWEAREKARKPIDHIDRKGYEVERCREENLN